MDLGQLTLAEITKILEALDSGLTEVKVTNEAASPVNVVLDAAMVTKINELHAALVVDKDAGFQLTGRYEVQDAVIAAAGTVSTEIDFRAYKYLSFLMPAAWTAATLTLKGSAVTGGTKVAIKNDTNTTFPAMTVAVDTIYSVDVNALMAAGVHFLALESSVAQVAERTIKVMCKA